MQRHQTTTAALEDVAGSGNGPGAAAGAAGRGDHKTAAALEYAGGGGAGGCGRRQRSRRWARHCSRGYLPRRPEDGGGAGGHRLSEGEGAGAGTFATRKMATARNNGDGAGTRAIDLTVFLLGRGPGSIRGSYSALCTVVGSPVDGWMRSTAERRRKGRLQRIWFRTDGQGRGASFDRVQPAFSPLATPQKNKKPSETQRKYIYLILIYIYIYIYT